MAFEEEAGAGEEGAEQNRMCHQLRHGPADELGEQADAVTGARSDCLCAALDYAARGWRVIPVSPRTKVSAISGWPERATTDPEQIHAWWAKWPDANVGIVAGPESGLLVLDVDGDPRELLGGREQPPTVTQHTGGGGLQYLYEWPQELNGASTRTGILPNIDTRGAGGYFVAPPSIHPSGNVYRWGEGMDPWEIHLAPPPQWLLDALCKPAVKGPLSDDPILQGERNARLTSLAGKLRNTGMDAAAIAANLLTTNRARCNPPLSEEEVRQIATSVARYPPRASVLDPATKPLPTTLAAVVSAFEAMYCKPDIDQLYVALGTAAANLLPNADPVWMLIVNPPSAGKTEVIRPLFAVDFCHEVGTLTEAALLSGTSRKERAKKSTGGLLRKIGEFGILLLKDFTSVLSMDRNARAQVIAALREIYDGFWTRLVGTDGGQALSWSGKVGLIGAVTNAYDSHFAVIGAMGDRFLLYRAPINRATSQERAAFKINAVGKERETRALLADVVHRLFAHLTPPEVVPALAKRQVQLLAHVATLVAICRSTVERDGRTREVELVHGEEAPMRVAGQLATLWHGLRLIGVPEDRQWPLIRKTAFDSMPPLRRLVIESLAQHGKRSTSEVAKDIAHPISTVRRALEDLTAHEAVIRLSSAAGKMDSWEMERDLLEIWKKAHA